jgi:hypothetical protein
MLNNLLFDLLLFMYRLEDAVDLIQLYHIVHPTAKSAGTKFEPGRELAFIKVIKKIHFYSVNTLDHQLL